MSCASTRPNAVSIRTEPRPFERDVGRYRIEVEFGARSLGRHSAYAEVHLNHGAGRHVDDEIGRGIRAAPRRGECAAACRQLVAERSIITHVDVRIAVAIERVTVPHAVEGEQHTKRLDTAEVFRSTQLSPVKTLAPDLDDDLAIRSLDDADLANEVVDRNAITAQPVQLLPLHRARDLREDRRRDCEGRQAAESEHRSPGRTATAMILRRIVPPSRVCVRANAGRIVPTARYNRRPDSRTRHLREGDYITEPARRALQPPCRG